MSYTIELEGSVTAAPIVAEHQPTVSKPSVATEGMGENASATELFSYAICCASQGLIGALYFVLVITIPALMSQGISLGLP